MSPSAAAARPRRAIAALVLCAALFMGSCSGSPTTQISSDAAPPSTVVDATSSTPGTAPTTTAEPGTSAPSPTTVTAPTGPITTPTAPALTTTTQPGTDPGTLPQTHDAPSTTSIAFRTGTDDLWRAIVEDDPAVAMPFFFPKAAYLQVKAIRDPSADYDGRLVAAYEEDIHALHRSLGADPAAAKLVRVTVPNTAQWINPGVEYNKGGYYRVFDSKLVYSVGGKEKSIPIKSMISWRGEWYVVHLTAIR